MQARAAIAVAVFMALLLAVATAIVLLFTDRLAGSGTPTLVIDPGVPQPPAGTPTPSATLAALQVPEGMEKALVASEPLAMDIVAMCFDEQGNLYLAESFRQEQGVEDNRSSAFWLDDDLASQSNDDRLAMYRKWANLRSNRMAYYTQFEDRVRRLRDEDGDGVFETATVFAGGFDDALDGTGAGLLALDGDVWFTCIPSLWRLRDEDGDGVAEVREIVQDGFGVRIALRGHDMHGLTLGMDGRIYWSIGDRGYHLELPDGTIEHSPGSGAVLRCERDGSNIEVFHHGLRNPQELAFDDYGNLITGDNNSDGGDRARIVYCVEGGETGWRMEYQTLEGDNRRGPWVQERVWELRNDEQPAWILPPLAHHTAGPSGLVAYPGVGLDERYDGHFFLCDFTGSPASSSVLSFGLEPDGAGFKVVDAHPFMEHVLCTDVDFGYDGRMYVSDWVQGWQGKYAGRVYAAWDPAHIEDADVTNIFRGGFGDYSRDELQEMLRNPDRRVRLRAQYELVDRGEITSLLEVAFSDGLSTADTVQRLHGLWGLAMAYRAGYPVDGERFIALLLQTADSEVRAHASRVIGELGLVAASPRLMRQVASGTPREQYFAAIALGSMNAAGATPVLVDLLAANDDRDLYLRHAAIVGLSRCSKAAEEMLALQEDPRPAVRLGAVLVLRRLRDARVALFLDDDDPAIATEAARAIHDVPLRGVFDALAEHLNSATSVPFARRAMSAAERSGDADHLQRLMDFAADGSGDSLMRREALDALRTWNHPPPRERVEGRWWPVEPRDEDVAGVLAGQIPTLLEDADRAVRAAAAAAATAHKVALPPDLARRLLADSSNPLMLRQQCLRQLADPAAIDRGLRDESPNLRATARDVLAGVDEQRGRAALLVALDTGTIIEQQQAILSLHAHGGVPSEVATAHQDGQLPAGLELELAEVDMATLGDPLEGRWLIDGGVIERGEEIFMDHARAQCGRCHAVGDHWAEAGPSLDGVALRLSPAKLLESLLAPNAVVADGYGDVSAMPLMGDLLSHRELRDVLAWLQSLDKEPEPADEDPIG